VRTAFRWLTSVLFAAIVVQVGLAGYGSFEAIHKAENSAVSKKTIEDGFNAHAALGSLIVIVMIVLLVVALAGGLGASSIRFSAILVGLGIVQLVLGIVSTSVPVLGFLHTVNALAIYAVSALLAHRTWSEHRKALPTPAPAT
jgi:small-conductance mechanosensitive channel